jgi:hypothetical protein
MFLKEVKIVSGVFDCLSLSRLNWQATEHGIFHSGADRFMS